MGDNRFAGNARSVAQVGTVHGDINHYFQQPERELEPAQQVLPPPRHYTNYERQLEKLDSILAPGQDGPRVAIIRGTPGSGRSTLASCWVYRHRADYPDGLFLVRLGKSVDGAELERPALKDLLEAAGYGDDQIPDSLDGRANRWRSWTAGKKIALVIDDVLRPAQVEALVPGAGPSAVLVTGVRSLKQLRATMSAEWVRIDPLSDKAARALLAAMTSEERVAAEPDAVNDLIRLCAGSAVALNVVGAMLAEDEDRGVERLVRVLAPEESTLSELSRDKSLSLTAVFDAAYDYLSPLAQRCYRVFGAHPGPGDIGAQTLVAVLGEPSADVDYALRELKNAMLVQEPAEDRYLISGLIQRHARAKTDIEVRDIVRYYRGRALAAGKGWMPKRPWLELFWPDLSAEPLGTAEAVRWLEAERVNLRAAVEAAYRLGELDWVCQLGIALWPLHEKKKYPHDMVATNRLGAQAADNDLKAAVLLFQQGFAHRQLGQFEQAAELFTAARDRAGRAGDPQVEATALESLGLALIDLGRGEQAEELLKRNLEMAEEIDDARRIALARLHLAKVSPAWEALAMLDQARAVLVGESDNLVKADLWRGKKLVEAGDFPRAGQVLADASVAATDGDWHLERGQVCEALADLAEAQGEVEVARSHLRDALEIYRLRGFTPQVVSVEARLA